MTDCVDRREPIAETAVDESEDGRGDDELVAQLQIECLGMARFALSNGLSVSAPYLQRLSAVTAQGGRGSVAERARELGAIHQELSRVVAPATPRTIVQLRAGADSRLHFLGPVPLVRQLSAAAILFLTGLLVVSLSGSVNLTNLNAGLLNSQGNILAVNELFLLCAAGVGASFSALFKVNSYIAKVTYDPRYDSSYWSQIILGIIAGVILVELLPNALFQGSQFGKPSLAMFGGFSASVVHRILLRLVETLETMVKGKTDGVAGAAMELRAKVSEQRSRINSEVAAQLVDLGKGIEQADGKTASQEINKAIKQLLGDGTG